MKMIALDYMQADKKFFVEAGREYHIAGLRVKCIKQNQPGDSYGYCLEREGKKIVYATDSEHREDVWDNEQPVLNFFRNADLLIFDAQYSFLESAHTKESWGLSSNILGVELSVSTDVKHLCLFHDEPACNGETLDAFLQVTRNYLKINSDTSPLKTDPAFDGFDVEI